jgi:hypothetical protein
VLELRAVCTSASDFINHIEPSNYGGEKIAEAICQHFVRHDFGRRQTVNVPCGYGSFQGTPGMREQLMVAFIDYFASNRAAGGRRDYYGVQVDGVADDGSELELTVTFKSGERYCCCESGCHTGFHSSESWRRLRALFGRHGLVEIPPVTIRLLRGVVEPGALLRCNLAFGLEEDVGEGFTYERGPYRERDA